jgi:hypothetical protein
MALFGAFVFMEGDDDAVVSQHDLDVQSDTGDDRDPLHGTGRPSRPVEAS